MREADEVNSSLSAPLQGIRFHATHHLLQFIEKDIEPNTNFVYLIAAVYLDSPCEIALTLSNILNASGQPG